MSDITNMNTRNAAGSQAGRDEDLAMIAAANASASDQGAYVPPGFNPDTLAVNPADIPQADADAKAAEEEAAAATSAEDAAVFEQARSLSTTNANTSTESLLGNYIDPNLVKITATMGENPSITYVETNGKAFDVNIQVDNKNAVEDLVKVLNPNAVQPVPNAVQPVKKGWFGFGGKGTKSRLSSGRRVHTKKNRKRRITRSNRKRARPSRRR